MKRLVNSLARIFGYEIRRLPPPPSPVLEKFIRTAEAPFEPEVPPETMPDSSLSHPMSTADGASSLIVEGWRFIPHSYAMVNQWQLLSLSKRPDIAVKLLDAPVPDRNWRVERGLFTPEAEQRLESFAAAAPDEDADFMLRIFHPFDFSPSRARRTAVFGTLEYQTILKGQCTDFRMYDRLRRGVPPPPEVMAVTPSRWSAEGFYRAGFKPEQVLVVPHGVDTGRFRPMPGARDAVRGALGLAREDFVFLVIGAMTPNKGVDLLLGAFAEVSRSFPQARLVLKGMTPLYNSRDHLLKLLRNISATEQARVIGKIRYYGSPFSNGKMALLYQAADAYVSPYRAEGFNLPVLEAAACGIPVICTGGGATDDFVSAAFARKIEAKKQSETIEDREFVALKPDIAHLAALMRSAIEDSSWRTMAATAGPAHVRANYTWDHAVNRLLQGLRA